MSEKWRDVEDWPYRVSNWGRVCHRKTGNIRKTFMAGYKLGYVYVGLWNRPRHMNVAVHTLVAGAFIGPRPKGLEVNHKNGVKTVNYPNNLEYMTPSQNSKHAYKLGLSSVPRLKGEQNGRAKLSENDMKKIRDMYHSGGGYKQVELAEEFGVTQGLISKIIRKVVWKE